MHVSPTLYLDLASPYAYLAAARIGHVFQDPVELQPILLGAIFQRRGWGSWAVTEARADGMAEIEARAQRYGLPALSWPADWPANSLAADRAAIWAQQQGAGDEFIHVLYRRQFVHGEDIARLEVIESAGSQVGLDGGAMLEGIRRPEIKERLRQATDEAWELGVRGVPTIVVGGNVFFGDDRLEEAAAGGEPTGD